jgi:hypothetical protein
MTKDQGWILLIEVGVLAFAALVRIVRGGA